MKRLLILLTLLSLGGCTTVTVTADNGARVEVKTDRIVTTLPVEAKGNTVPLAY